MKHPFTDVIITILQQHFGSDRGTTLLTHSPLLQYLNIKTRSANRGSKARSAFANHYALYVLVEDYIQQGFLVADPGAYSAYAGARFTDLLLRQRQLPFGAKLQNHALNSRVNDEFAKYFPMLALRPILRDQAQQRYWINEQLLLVPMEVGLSQSTVNIAQVILDIIDAYIMTKRSAFEEFLAACEQIRALPQTDAFMAVEFITRHIQKEADARIFEIISFAILKTYYGEQVVFWGWHLDAIQPEALTLYKTGRTNANDGGIDFVMRPLGRFFQVTETLDVHKFFLDIDKIQHYPLNFVIKTDMTIEEVRQQLYDRAQQHYGVVVIVKRFMDGIESIINIPLLIQMFQTVIANGHLEQVINEVILQSRIEFNL